MTKHKWIRNQLVNLNKLASPRCQLIAPNWCSAHAQLMVEIRFLCNVLIYKSPDWSLFPCDLALMPDLWLPAQVTIAHIQVNLDMTDSMGPGKLVCHMQNPSYTYDEYLICIGLGPSISSVICKNPSYSGPSYPSSPVVIGLSLSTYPFFLHSSYGWYL